METLELKTIISKMINEITAQNSRLNSVEERIDNFEDVWTTCHLSILLLMDLLTTVITPL